MALTTLSECSQPRVGLLTKEPCLVHSSPPSWPPSTRALREAPPSRFISCGGRGGGDGAVRERRGRGGEELAAKFPVSSRDPLKPPRPPDTLACLLEAFRPGSRVEDTPSRRAPILGKKEQRVVGLFSACCGDEGGRMGVSEEEEREGGIPGGVSGVRGAEEGREELDAVSSVELKESLLKGVYLVLGISSIGVSAVSVSTKSP